MKSVLGYLLLAIIVATVIGFSIHISTQPQNNNSTPIPTNTTEQASASTPSQVQPSGSQPLESGCPQEGHIKSPSSYDKATITFDNQTAGDLKVYWIDFNGKRKFYNFVKAHSKYDQETWVGHVWVVTDKAEQCLKLHSANAVKQILVIN